MEGPNFHLSFIPKQGDAIKHLETLIKKGEMSSLLKDVLKRNKIRPDHVSVEETESGKGQKGGVFEGFNYKKYSGKLSGDRRKLMGKRPFITRFEITLLKGIRKDKDGLLVKSMYQHGTSDAKLVTEGLFNTLLEQMGQQGPVQWNRIARTGTF